MTSTLTAPAATARRTILTDDIIARCGERAARYDQENSFFWEDFQELKDLGYLLIGVPEEFGGLGFTFSEVMDEQRRLARRAPATALALNMHHYWVGIASDLRAWGDPSLEWILRDAAAGEVFAAGHGETGNELAPELSTTIARRVEGGYRVTGRKIFGTLSPVWTRFGFHAVDPEAEGRPQIIHGFLPRDAQGYTIKETWDVLGMRATQSQDTLLEDAFVADSHVARVIPAGSAEDPFLLAMAARALLGFGAVYTGLAERAFELGVEMAQKRTSIALERGSMAYNPEVQHVIADMAVELDAIRAHLRSSVDDWSNHVDHGMDWVIKIAGTKHHVVEAARRIVDGALTVSGGAGMFRKNELERLYRDVRAGGFHPYNSLLMHEVVGKVALGINPEEAPRWG